jgi:transcription elongation GreA/GreB family factor
VTEALITRGGLMRLNSELEHLTNDGREEIAERLRHAISTDANILENNDYLDALNDLGELERRIALLRQRIRCAQIAEPDRSNDLAEVGKRVRLRDLETGEAAEYELVGTLEARSSRHSDKPFWASASAKPRLSRPRKAGSTTRSWQSRHRSCPC